MDIRNNVCNEVKSPRARPWYFDISVFYCTHLYSAFSYSNCLYSACTPGCIGPNCTVICRYPGYGVRCQSECTCVEEQCDPITGCGSILYIYLN